MGSFMGHLLPGMLFMLYGTWLSFKFSYRHFVKKRSKSRKRCCACNMETIEIALLISLPSVGILLEQIVSNGPKLHLLNSSSEFQDGNNWSHCTMYLYFVFIGIVDLLRLLHPQCTPRGVKEFMTALALLIESYLFYFHTHGKPGLEIRIHVLLLLAISAGAGVWILLGALDSLIRDDIHTGDYMKLTNLEQDTETTLLDEGNKYSDDVEEQLVTENGTNGRNPRLSSELLTLSTLLKKDLLKALSTRHCETSHLKIVLQLTTAISFLLQGTWFCQIAAILYPPGRKPWQDTLTNTTFATIFFAWHVVAAIAIVSVIYVAVCAVTSRNRRRVVL